MSALRFPLCITLCVFSITVFSQEKKVEKSAVVLVDQYGKEKVAEEKNLNLSFIGLLSFQRGTKKYFCNIVHLTENLAITSETCFSAHSSKEQTVAREIEILFFDKTGKKRTEKIPFSALTQKDHSPTVFQLPTELRSAWSFSGNTPQKEEIWFGGFKPTWELVRVWGFVPAGENRFQMQINSCKSARQIPYLQRVQWREDKEREDVIEEIRVFDQKSPYASFLVLEDCTKSKDGALGGALITLSKNFEAKLGVLDFASFSPFGTRILSALSIPEDRIFLRYVGSDAQEHPVPKDLSSLKIHFSLPLSGI